MGGGQWAKPMSSSGQTRAAIDDDEIPLHGKALLFLPSLGFDKLIRLEKDVSQIIQHHGRYLKGLHVVFCLMVNEE